TAHVGWTTIKKNYKKFWATLDELIVSMEHPKETLPGSMVQNKQNDELRTVRLAVAPTLEPVSGQSSCRRRRWLRHAAVARPDLSIKWPAKSMSVIEPIISSRHGSDSPFICTVAAITMRQVTKRRIRRARRPAAACGSA